MDTYDRPDNTGQERYPNDQDMSYGQPGPPEDEYMGSTEQQEGMEEVFSNVGQGLTGNFRNMMMAYWQETISNIENEDHDFKNHSLPLARIKKVMKTDEDVKMISAEAPVLFAKGCEVFITELTMRAWIHAEENKRRTLQRSDIACALQKSDMFDFLIDIVPREEAKTRKSSHFENNPDQLQLHHQQMAQYGQGAVAGLGPGQMYQPSVMDGTNPQLVQPQHQQSTSPSGPYPHGPIPVSVQQSLELSNTDVAITHGGNAHVPSVQGLHNEFITTADGYGMPNSNYMPYNG